LNKDFYEVCNIIIDEIANVLLQTDKIKIEQFIGYILKSHNIFCAGAGRSRYVLTSFCMRLNQLGINSFMVGSTNCPSAGSNDLLIACSGSGQTTTITTIMKNASRLNLPIALITASEKNEASDIVDLIISLPAQSTLIDSDSTRIQPMRTLFEQSAFLLFDTVILILQNRLGIDSKEMAKRHSNLE